MSLAATPVPKSQRDKNMRKEHGPGLLDKLWKKVVPAKATPAPGKGGAVETVTRTVGGKTLTLSMSLDPDPVKLTDSRQFKVSMRVANQSKKLVQLEFPTTQRIEVIVRNTAGKLVEQWSEDRSFANEPGMVSINPGEHLEYAATLSTRDMVAGEAYVVEALFPQYEPLRLQKMVTPVK